MTESRERIRQLMNKWALWRRSGRLGKELYWPSVSLTGRFLQDMGGKCPRCKGSGEVSGAPLGYNGKLTCPRCHGSGRVRLDTDGKINPAFIRATKGKRDDEEMVLIDKEMCNMRKSPKHNSYFFILYQEYCRSGTPEIKADRLHISISNYHTRLDRALKRIEKGLTSVI